MIYLLALLIALLSYMYGCFSTARIVAKSARSLNIFKIGTGFADTENIYCNVSKPMGVLVGALDVVKAMLYLAVVESVLRFCEPMMTLEGLDLLYSANFMLIYGLAMLVGHTLPITHGYRGGRGIFTYIGFVAYFAFLPMLVTVVLAWLIVLIYKQIRFAQYLIVILPVILTQVFFSFIPWFRRELPPHFVTILLGISLLMGILNFIVSKKLGEI
ncbi:MAG: glycerol-3-phosphate acyltransferase [Candidatus Cloacimonadaceae bacterium]|nr:glycerol-3-phosphate acyltransferase [Candidatus Cloacimonadaceae bacterium]MDP3115365.1 glycerol-3-phosphate acyltransferase [Candidatus Cloacimonadaceae bacterium]